MPFDQLDLELAWVRLKLDHRDQCFVDYPHLTALVEADVPAWLDELREKIGPAYRARDCTVCDCPKAGWLVRPGTVLNLEDEVVYNAIVGHFHDAVWGRIGPSQGVLDMGYQLAEPGQPAWMERGARSSTNWRDRSIEVLDEGFSHVLMADVAAFYENIDLNRLNSDLREIGAADQLITVLSDCLKRWSAPRGKGIPQGYSASNILAKLYMSNVDTRLQDAGYRHFRYVDDFRIFCSSELEARQALLDLNRLLRGRGLNLQSAKTKIVDADRARTEISGVGPQIDQVKDLLFGEIREWADFVGAYITLEEIEQMLEGQGDTPAKDVLERAFSEYLLSDEMEFDKSLFHFLLTRLGIVGSDVAVDYCVEALVQHPEETQYILRYFSKVGLAAGPVQSLASFCVSDEAIYDYQLYQIIGWFCDAKQYPAAIVRACRRWAGDMNRPSWLRARCMCILGSAGSVADLEWMEERYPAAVDENERIAIAMGLARMERGRRNAFLGRVARDSTLIGRAAAATRNQGP